MPRHPLPARRPAFEPFPRSALDRSIPARFEQQVDRAPDRPAVTIDGVTWSYGTLDAAANRVAHALLRRSATGRPVAVLIEPGLHLAAAILGALKAGAIYVPLEAWHEPARVAEIVAEAGAETILAGAAGTALAAAAAPKTTCLAIPEILAGRGDETRPGVAVPPSALAYVYYTSGTTGRPKGVVDTHASVLHNVMRYTNTLGIDRDDRLTLLQSPSSSGAVSSLFGALLNGAVSCAYAVRHAGPAGLGAWLVRERVSIHHSVPALFRLAAAGAGAFPDLRLIRLEGDRMTFRDWQTFRERFASGCLLVNGLGATECGLVRQFVVSPDMEPLDGVVPVGYPVEDMDVRILAEDGAPAAPGEVGEIAVRSAFLAAGYWRRPDLTALAFTPDRDAPGARVYHTGDLGRLAPDGCLDHLGRRDSRQKIGGEWVDLAQVEAALATADGVREAAVRVHPGPDDEPRIVGYVVPADGAAPTWTDLRGHLATRLPAAALPGAFVKLAALPLTDSGKVDRSALPLPGGERPDLAEPYVAPRSALESAVAAIWIDVLGIDRVGVHDRFLDLGGESLALGRVHARLQAWLGRELSIVSLFDLATVEAVAAHLERGDLAGASRVRTPRRRKPGARLAGGAVYTGAVDGPPSAVRKEDPMAVGEAPIKQAITWIDEQLHVNPGANRAKLVDEAGRRFDLTPLDADFLARHLAERKAP